MGVQMNVSFYNQYWSKLVLLGDMYLPPPLGGPSGPPLPPAGPFGPPRGVGRYISPKSTRLNSYWLWNETFTFPPLSSL